VATSERAPPHEFRRDYETAVKPDNEREAFHLRLRGSLRRYFIAGLLTILPLVISIWIVSWLIDILESAMRLLPRALQPENLLPFYIPGLGAILTLALIVFVGFVVSNVVIQRLQRTINQLLLRIPVFRGVYSAMQRLVDAVVAQTHQEFRRVVLVEYPRRGIYAIGLMTGVGRGEVQEKTGGNLINVFVPTTPNPTSGYLVLVPEDDVIYLDMSVEEAFKLVMSGGIVAPDHHENAD